jgi:hypothetical protein
LAIPLASASALQRTALIWDPDHDIKITGIQFTYNVASDSNSFTSTTLDIGVDGALQRYCAFVPVISKAVGTISNATLLNPTVLLPKGTALVITKTAGTSTNTGFCQALVCYELIDTKAA